MNVCRNEAIFKDFSIYQPHIKAKPKPKPNVTSWEFKSASDEDINWKDIKNSLSYKEPLALVTRTFKDGSIENYVVISSRLLAKSIDANIPHPNIIYKPEKGVFLIISEFSEWVDWVKHVKAATWNDPLKSTVNVILPTI